MKENHILMHADVLDAVLADYSGRFVSRRDYNDGKTYGYVTNLKNQNMAIEYTHYKNQLGERHALSDNERFDFDNQMIKNTYLKWRSGSRKSSARRALRCACRYPCRCRYILTEAAVAWTKTAVRVNF